MNKGNIFRFHDQLTRRSFKADSCIIRTRGHKGRMVAQLVRSIELEKMRTEVVVVYLPEDTPTVETKSG
jgi:flagellar biosynthesis/type III secretory pathway ATPase